MTLNRSCLKIEHHWYQWLFPETTVTTSSEWYLQRLFFSLFNYIVYLLGGKVNPITLFNSTEFCSFKFVQHRSLCSPWVKPFVSEKPADKLRGDPPNLWVLVTPRRTRRSRTASATWHNDTKIPSGAICFKVQVKGCWGWKRNPSFGQSLHGTVPLFLDRHICYRGFSVQKWKGRLYWDLDFGLYFLGTFLRYIWKIWYQPRTLATK